MIIKETTIEILKKCQQNKDREMAHYDADAALCRFLTELGYADVVEEFDKITKWYA